MKYLLAFCIVFPVFAADNTIYIEQAGSNNTFAITQEGTGHSVSITTGTVSDVDYSYFTVTQQGSGSKTASITVPSGINNSINISQDGTGSHTASILNLNGSANQLSISQSGAGNHSFSVVGTAGTTNDANVLNAQQSGGSGADKTFNLWLNGATGANITVQQTNATQANQGGMSVTCMPGTCGNWSYVRN